MKKILSVFIVWTFALCALAQEAVPFRFGCINYQEVLTSMPEYAQAEENFDALKEKYDAEMQVSEEEFNSKYEAFLSEYDNFAPSILRKRQLELEDMMRRNEMFRAETIRLLEQAKVDVIRPVREKLDAAIKDISAKYSLAFVLNTDSDIVPFVNTSMAYDITQAVKDALTK